MTAQGGGLVDVAAAAAGRLAAAPATLAFGRGGETSFTLTNLSGRDLPVTLAVRRQDHGAAAARFSLDPARAVIRPGASVVVRLRAHAEPAAAPIEGVVVARVRGGGAIRVPWAIAPAARGPLLGAVSLAPAAFAASDTQPALLTVDAGRVLAGSGAAEIRPLARLDVELYRSTGERVGLLARLRDVLPGRIEFGLTGRDPTGTLLPPGRYVVRVVATSVDGSRPTSRKVRFTLR